MVDLAATCEGAGHCRCGRFSNGKDSMIHPSSLVLSLRPHPPFSFVGRWMVVCCDLRWGAGPVTAVARRWRDACSKVRSDEVQDGPSSSHSEGPAFYPSLKQKTTILSHFSGVPPSASTRTDQADPSHSGVRVGRAKETNSPYAPSLEPSRQGHAVSPSLEQAVHRVTSSPYLHASLSRPESPSHRPRHFPRSAGRLSGGCRCLWADRPGPASS